MKRLLQIGPVSRILLTLLIALGFYLILHRFISWKLSLLLAWSGAALCYLAQMFAMFSNLDAAAVKERSQDQKTEGDTPMLVGVILSAVVSIGAVMYLLNDVHPAGSHYKLHLSFSIVAIFSTWFVLQSMFSVYYARLYYETPKGGPPGTISGGMRFTTEEAPDYWDFLYFAFTLAMCYGVSDIAVTSRSIRKVTLIQSLLSFFYYTVIIGLVMNVMGTLF